MYHAAAAAMAFDASMRRVAETVADTATQQLRLKSALHGAGAAYVKVGWDDVLQQPTHELLDPGEIVPSVAYPPPPSAREPDRPLRRMLGHPEAEPHDWVRRRMSVPPEHWRDLGEAE